MTHATGLLADIGGTNVRFALDRPGAGWREERSFKVADFPGLTEAARAYLDAVRPETPPTRGAFCIASPVFGDHVRMTNAAWTFSVEETRAALGLESLRVVNDFVANALACPRLKPDEAVQVGGGFAHTGGPIAAIGPGTGLGVALLVPTADGLLTPVATEGGHVTLPATDEREAAVLRLLRDTWGHVSAERVVSGPGLALLHDALRRLDGEAPDGRTPKEITAAALAGDRACAETLSLFCAFLGTVAGNLALTTGATGGVFLLGGILPRILPFFQDSPFRARFEDKGRFRDYLSRIPTAVVVHPYAAFLGLEGLCFPDAVG